MLDITIKDLAQATSAEIIAAGSGRVSGKTVIDSREVEPGALFVAFKGERSDGNRYARAAIDAGASAVVLSDAPEEGLAAYAEDRGAALLRAADDDCESFLIDLSAWERDRHPEWLVVGVTGSVGKTTTKDMLAAALSPSEVISVTMLEDGKSCRVIVPDSQLSLAIGKEGQNARLAAKLTGYKIDIKPESEA